jgi:hypothetical protein
LGEGTLGVSPRAHPRARAHARSKTRPERNSSTKALSARTDFRAAVPVALKDSALVAVERFADAAAAADDALALKRAVVALVADARHRRLPHQAVADDALALALSAQPAHRRPWLLAAEDQVRVVLGHGRPPLRPGARLDCASAARRRVDGEAPLLRSPPKRAAVAKLNQFTCESQLSFWLPVF